MNNVDQFKNLILDPTLKDTGLYSQEASDLLLGTALAESNLEFFKQIGGGPALGFMQMEPLTFNDIFHRYLEREDKAHLKRKVHLMMVPYNQNFSMTFSLQQLITNLPFAIMMARIRYLMVPAPIPKNVEGQAEYWKTYYNTEEGAGTVEKYIKSWKTYKED